MRNPYTRAIGSLAVALIFSSIAMALPQQGTHEGSVWKYEGRNRSVGTGGPAPVHDLSGSWAGPRSGAGVPDSKPGDVPSMTPLGKSFLAPIRACRSTTPPGQTIQW